jgi:RNA polymerase sigma-70 factor (ECF subfamily)
VALGSLRRLLGRDDDAELVQAIRDGDERAFAELVDRHHASLVRVAQGYVRDRAVAEEVAQDTWLAVLKGIDRFEGRSSLKTWIFRILANQAKSRAARERRTVPFSALTDADGDPDAPSVDPNRFDSATGMWSRPPGRWPDEPEGELLRGEARRVVLDAIGGLPDGQRAVITLRDVEGFDSAEACNVLGISEVNQRVLLHRARARVRQALEDYFEEEARA